MDPGGAAGAHALEIPFIAVLPFVLLILTIAILPLVTRAWWERLRNQALAAFVIALPVAIFLLRRDPARLAQTGGDYLAFIALLGSLYVISGGILVAGDPMATPAVNTAFLGVGALLANVIGTTGASMLLIRPVLHANAERKWKAHIPVFFIFLVSNIGGCLTPLGDPPLFLGYLLGVPFFWTLRLFLPWATMCGLLLVMFYLFDRRMVRQESPADLRLDRANATPLRVHGLHNFLFLAGVLVSVFLPHSVAGLRPLLMIVMAAGSYLTTPRWIHLGNRFTFASIEEVAVLFAGIFVTMTPALLLLESHGAELGLTRPWQFFWLTGSLSSFLDNAPTYLVFSSLAAGAAGTGFRENLPMLGLTHHAFGAELLRAISLGAVFMGANTYIGNGPNFMVKSLSEQRGVAMPGFFGYMRWSMMILIPLFLLVTVLYLL